MLILTVGSPGDDTMTAELMGLCAAPRENEVKRPRCPLDRRPHSASSASLSLFHRVKSHFLASNYSFVNEAGSILFGVGVKQHGRARQRENGTHKNGRTQLT